MIKAAYLDKRQTGLIRKVVKFQLEVLRDIKRNNIESDITLFCIQNDLTREELDDFIMERQKVYYDIYRQPEKLFSLDERNVSLVKTILATAISSKKYAKPKKQIWNKLDIVERVQIYSSLN